MTIWRDPEPVDPSILDTFRLNPLVAQTLIRRGITTPAAAHAFLNLGSTPSLSFPKVEGAVGRIQAAIRTGERIGVWGDFDVDGQTATTVLVQALQAMGAHVTYYIPIRGKEGHGIHVATLAPMLDQGVTLLLTCDTGITAHSAVDYATSRGVDVIITDHHDPGESLPHANAIINPKLLPADHPLGTLAGVGVAYKLAEALLDGQTAPDHPASIENGLSAKHFLDLVALGLIADVALLKGETRLLVQQGIQALRETHRLGLKVMAELSGTNLETLTEETIGFAFAPRLNALGRLSDANPAVELLLTSDPARARVLAAQVEGLNAQRRLLTSQVYEAAESKLHENPDWLTEPVILLSHANWPGGVVGIVANRLVERYHKPVILLTESEEGILRGSARSVEGLHITQAITTQKEHLLSFGGHPMAAGVALQRDKLGEFKRGLGKAIEKQLGTATREEPVLQIDGWMGLEEINLELANALESMAPFGAGNPPLVLASRAVQLKSVSTMGKAKEHLRITVEDGKGNAQSVLWWGGAGNDLPEEGSIIDLAYSLRASTFRGKRQVTLQFEDLRVIEEKIVLNASRIDVEDWRLQTGKINELNESVLVWAEAADQSKGKNRFELYPADEFAIYTTPPSPADLRSALELVKPKKIYLLAVPPATPNKSSLLKITDEFLSRLAGLAKYVINQRGGKVTTQELAAATGQREGAVSIGLEWLAAGGHISIQTDVQADSIRLSGGNAQQNQYLQKELYIAVKGILEETAAYHAHFARASVEALIQ